LQANDLRQAETCVDGVVELAPGAVCKMEGGSLSEQILWSPWSFTGADRRLAPGALVEQLRDTVCETISAIAGDYRHIVVGISGGLDSSIVSAALAAGRHRFSCLTAATDDPSGDERRYALAVADATGAELSAHFYDPDRIDIERSAAAHLPRPIAKPFMQELEWAYAIETAAHDADAIFTGNGGDNAFCFLHSAAPVVDRLCSERGLPWRTLLDMCSVTQCDVPTMVRATANLLRHRRQAPAAALDMTFLNRARATASRAPLLTPYLDTAPVKYPGKLAHVNLLIRIQNYVEGYDRALFPPVVAPLLAQPIIETCLRIPTWEWCAGGINRSAARRAFADMLPREIVRRTSKSGPDSLTAAVFESNRARLRERLLDGVLRQHEIIDRSAIERALADPRSGQQQILFRLLDLADAEAWARSRSSGVTAGTPLM
jgi:asparagine synthase (glutamine-hydrolysing)